MNVNKIGHEHIIIGTNMQDAVLEKENLKVVADGCSGAKHSEVGAKLFCKLIGDDFSIEHAFKILQVLMGNNYKDMSDYLSFTFFIVREYEDKYVVDYCGDGFIIERVGDIITYKEIDNGEYPEYYIYNYIDKDKLKKYKDGVSYHTVEYLKSDYDNIGVSTDGIRFFINNNLEFKLNEFILSGKSIRMKRFINANHSTFKDDIGLVI